MYNSVVIPHHPYTLRLVGSVLGLIRVVSLAFLGGTMAAHAAEVDFNQYTSPTDNDLVNHFNNPGGLTQTTTGGLTGGAVIPTAFNENPVFMDSFHPLVGSGLTVSMAFRFDTSVLGDPGSGPSLQLGFVGTPDMGLDFFNGDLYFFGHFFNDGSLGIFSRGSAPNGFHTVDTFAPPPSGNWLELEFSEQHLGADDFLLSVRLVDLGVDGTGFTELGQGSITVDHPMAAADSTVFGSFNGYYHVSHFDNFSVVPEPGMMTMAILGLGGMLVAGGRVRKR